MKKIFLIALISFCAQFPILSATVTTCKPEESKAEYCICGSKEMLIKMLSATMHAHVAEHIKAYAEASNDQTSTNDKKLAEFRRLIEQYENNKSEVKNQLQKLVDEVEAEKIIEQAENSVQTQVRW